MMYRKYIYGSGLILKSCPTLVTPWTGSPPGYSAHGIFQARILEWVLSFPSPGDLPDPGSELESLAL